MRTSPRARWAAGVVIVGLALGAAGCGSSGGSSGGSGGSGGSSRSASTGPLNVLVITDLSGQDKAYGAQELLGLKAAAAYYNAKGGVDGRKFVIKSADDGGSPSTATSIAVKDLSGGGASKYAMVYAGWGGSDTAALIQVMAKMKTFTTMIDDVTNECAKVSVCPYAFSVTGPTTLDLTKDTKWLVGKKYKKVGVLAEQYGFQEAVAPILKAEFTKAGLSPFFANFPLSATDVTPQMAKLKSGGAQVVFGDLVGPPAGYAITARAKTGLKAPILYDAAASSIDVTKLAPASELSQVYLTAPYPVNSANKLPALAQVKKYAPAGSISVIPANVVAGGWSAVQLLYHAYQGAKSTDGAALTKAAESLPAAAQSDPLNLSTAKVRYTAGDHQNVGETIDDFDVIPAGPISGGQVQSK